MKRKPTLEHKTVKKTVFFANPSSRFVAVIILVITILLLATIFVKAVSKVHVLGAATGPVLLADQGDQQDSNQSGDQPTPTQNGDQQNPSPQPTGEVHTSADQKSPSEVLVDCVGPDGKHFTTSFHDCQDINKQIHTFQFTPLSKPGENKMDGANEPTGEPTAEPTREATHQNIETPQGHFEAQTEGNKGELNLETAGMHIEMKREGNGSTKIVAHKIDGTEVQLQTNAIDQINEALKEKDVEVSTSSAKGFAITSAGVQAETNFPLSIDPTTKSLAVTTPNGTTDVTTLPNQAVQNAVQQGHLTNVLSTANQTTPNETAGTNTLSLTELDNKPVYAVQGVANKNLLGLFPVAFRKTVYVSAQDGQVVQVQQSLLNQLLQALSF